MATGESSPEEIILQYMIMLKVVEGDWLICGYS